MRTVVNTPAGNVGRVVTERLLDSNEEVVIVSCNPDKVVDLVRRGAILVEGSIDDAAVLDRAVKGAHALFWVTPPAYDRPDFLEWAVLAARTAANAARKNGVRRVIVLSSAGAQHGPGAGPIGVLRSVEAAFTEAVPHTTSLRAGFFMENFLHSASTIAADGIILSPLIASEKIPMVATRDIAKKAAEILRNADWSGPRIIGVHGPEDLDSTTAAQIIGAGIGRPVRYVEVTVDRARQAMLDASMPEYAADLLAEMYTAVRRGGTKCAEPRTAETTTETSLLEFARQVLKPAVEAAGRS